MSCDVGEVTERLENEQNFTSPTSKLILQPFRRFTYVTAHSPTLPLLHLRHSSFSKTSFGSPMTQDFHLRHLASRPCECTVYSGRLCVNWWIWTDPDEQNDVSSSLHRIRLTWRHKKKVTAASYCTLSPYLTQWATYRPSPALSAVKVPPRPTPAAWCLPPQLIFIRYCIYICFYS